MDVNDIRSIVTLFSLLLFAGLVTYSWWPTRQRANEEAALLPFTGEADDAIPGAHDE